MNRTIILSTITAIPVGTQFDLPQLLSSSWTALNRSERHKLGKQFKQDVLAGLYPNIKFIDSNKNNAQYQKI